MSDSIYAHTLTEGADGNDYAIGRVSGKRIKAADHGGYIVARRIHDYAGAVVRKQTTAIWEPIAHDISHDEAVTLINDLVGRRAWTSIPVRREAA